MTSNEMPIADSVNVTVGWDPSAGNVSYRVTVVPALTLGESNKFVTMISTQGRIQDLKKGGAKCTENFRCATPTFVTRARLWVWSNATSLALRPLALEL